MPRPINKTFGRCRCPWIGCKEIAHIRRFKDSDRGRIYVWCKTHGRIFDGAPEYVEQLDKDGRVKWIEPPAAEPIQDPVDAKTAPVTPPPATKPRGFFHWLNDWTW